MQYEGLAKRAFDITGSITGLALSSVPLICSSFALAILHKGNPFFVQERIGLNQQPFKIFKLRTMSDETDPEGNLLPIEERVSKVGKFLRKTKLDELPQLINVLKGNMSLVGPRPHSNHNSNYIVSDDVKRHTIKPGMTGYAQLFNTNAPCRQTKLELDHHYVDNHNLKDDILICLKTPYAIIKNYNEPHYDKAFDTQTNTI